MQEGERASSLLPHEDNPADKGKGLRTQKKGKAGAGRGQGKAKKLSLLGPTALARGELSMSEAPGAAIIHVCSSWRPCSLYKLGSLSCPCWISQLSSEVS